MFSLEEKLKHVFLADLCEANVRIPKVGNGTLEDLRNALRDAVKNLFPASYPGIIGTYENRVIIEVEQQGKTLLFEIPYEVLKGSITLGTPIQVQKKVSYTKTEARTGMSVEGSLSEAQRREQRLAGVGDDNTRSLHEKTPARMELRECLFDSGAVKIVENEVLLESGKVAKPMLISGTAAKVGVTANDRFYSKKLWQTVIPKAMEKIENSTLLAELDHPLPQGSSGRLAQTAAKFTQLAFDGDYLTYEAEILDTPSGKTLRQLLSGGVHVGVSTRGFGKAKKGLVSGRQVEIIDESDYDLVAIDLVTDPATPEAGIDHYK
jgi:hypothetical protein